MKTNILCLILPALLLACGGGGSSKPPVKAPGIVTQPQPQTQTVTDGQPATITVVASGTTPLTYRWMKDGTTQVGANFSTLSIAAAHASDAGNYTVIVSNGIEPAATSSSATLIVGPAVSGAHSITGDVGGDGQQSCIIHLAGPVSATAQANPVSYTFSNLPDGTYTITPVSSDCTYIPTSYTVTLNGADVTGKDFDSYFGSGTDMWLDSVYIADATHGFAGSIGYVLNWDGNSWTKTSAGSAGTEFSSVSGSSANDVWAVALDGTIVYWNGNVWSTVTSPVDTESLFSVWSRAADDAWIGGRTSLLHWDGSNWSPTSNNRSGGTGAGSCFWGAAGNDVWVGASAGLFHWNGSIWNATNGPDMIQALYGFASNDIWAVGVDGVIFHWTGTSWISVSSPVTTLLNGVWGCAPDNVWAVGDSGVLLHYDGNTWATEDSGTSLQLMSVSGSGPDNVWIAGRPVLLRIR